MKKIILKIFETIIFIIVFSLNAFATDIVYDFYGEELKDYFVGKIIEDLDLEKDSIYGPGYMEIANELNTDDNLLVLKYIDDHYDDVLKQEHSNILYADTSKLKVGKGVNNNEEKSRLGRNRKIDAVIRVREKKEVIEEKKAIASEEKESKKEGMKITIYVKSLASNPNNPEPGVSYTANHIYYTECGTLTELMNEEGMTDDTDFIETIDGIFSHDTIEEEVNEDGSHGKWKGNYWCLYVNGKKSDVGADMIELEDGMRIKWIEIIDETKW